MPLRPYFLAVGSQGRVLEQGSYSRTLDTTIWLLVQAGGRGRAGNTETKQEAVGSNEVVTTDSEKTLSLIRVGPVPWNPGFT